jgi:hypothetical protein
MRGEDQAAIVDYLPDCFGMDVLIEGHIDAFEHIFSLK